MFSTNELSALYNIRRGGLGVVCRIGGVPPVPPKDDATSFHSHDFALPVPPSLVPNLLPHGFPILAAEKISSLFQRRIIGLKADFEARFQSIVSSWCEAIVDHNTQQRIDSLKAMYVARYTRLVRHWAANTISASAIRCQELKASAIHATSIESPSTIEKRGTFSTSAIAILEHAFAIEHYPGPEERRRLARESELTLKQVNVWFQNHRSRMSTERKNIKRAVFVDSCKTITRSVTSTSPSSRDPATSAEDVPLELPGDHYHQTECPVFGLLEREADTLVLVGRAPEHAFPAFYPPSCSYDPFPLNRLRFSLPWIRMTTDPRPRHANPRPIDMDELSNLLSCLKIHDSSEADNADSLSHSQGNFTVQSAAFVVKPLNAPLPALIRAAVTVRAPSPAQSLVYFTPPPPPTSTKSTQSVLRPILAASNSPPSHVKPSRKATSRQMQATNVIPISSRRYGHPYASARHLSSKSRSLSASSIASESSSRSNFSSSSSVDTPLSTPPPLPVPLPLTKTFTSYCTPHSPPMLSC